MKFAYSSRIVMALSTVTMNKKLLRRFLFANVRITQESYRENAFSVPTRFSNGRSTLLQTPLSDQTTSSCFHSLHSSPIYKPLSNIINNRYIEMLLTWGVQDQADTTGCQQCQAAKADEEPNLWLSHFIWWTTLIWAPYTVSKCIINSANPR